MGRDCTVSEPPGGPTHSVSGLIVLRERGTESKVHGAEHHGVGQHLRHLTRTRRQGKEDTRRQEDKQQHRNHDVEVHFISYPRQFLQGCG